MAGPPPLSAQKFHSTLKAIELGMQAEPSAKLSLNKGQVVATPMTHEQVTPVVYEAILTLIASNSSSITPQDLGGLQKIRQFLLSSGQNSETVTKTLGIIDSVLREQNPSALLQGVTTGDVRSVCLFVDYVHDVVGSSNFQEACALLRSFLNSAPSSCCSFFWMYVSCKNWASDFVPFIKQLKDISYDFTLDFQSLYAVMPYACKEKVSENLVKKTVSDFARFIEAAAKVQAIAVRSEDSNISCDEKFLKAIRPHLEKLQHLDLSGFFEINLNSLDITKLSSIQTLTLPISDRDTAALIRGTTLKKIAHVQKVLLLTANESSLASEHVVGMLNDCNKLSPSVLGNFFLRKETQSHLLQQIKKASVHIDSENIEAFQVCFSRREASAYQLQQLFLQSNEPVDATLLAATLAPLSNLEELHINMPLGGNGAVLVSCLQKLPRLQHLFIKCSDKAAVLALEPLLPRLSSLEILLDSPDIGIALTELLQRHASHSSITSLTVRMPDGAVPPLLLQSCIQLPNLTSFSVDAQGVNDEGVAVIARKETLQKLQISLNEVDARSCFKETGVALLCKMPRLNFCSLTGNSALSCEKVHEIIRNSKVNQFLYKPVKESSEPVDALTLLLGRRTLM